MSREKEAIEKEKNDIIGDAKIALELLKCAYGGGSPESKKELQKLGFIKSALTENGKLFLKISLAEIIYLAEK